MNDPAPIETPTETTARIPVSTYRLQFNRQFTFHQAAELVPYLNALGISDCYASPFLKARTGSSHGYDIVDPTVVNPELGSDEDFAVFTENVRRFGMGVIIDVVPNHMCITEADNRWWMDVLENGPGSPFAQYFDIDWHPPKIDLVNKVHLPILGDQYGKILENGEIRLEYELGAFWIRYYQARLPVAPRTWTRILDRVLEEMRSVTSDDPQRLELESIRTALFHLPLPTETAPEKTKERRREKEIAGKRLAALIGKSTAVHDTLGTVVEAFNGIKGHPRSFDQLEALLAEQSYRLCYWRVAADEVNFRRFFDINDLAAIRMENPEVFKSVHETLFRFVSEGWVSGLRIDHVDGLFDPELYLSDLQRHCYESAPKPEPAGTRPRETNRSFYVVVEKILAPGERLKSSWPVHGTTGYDFLNLANGVFIDHVQHRSFRRIYHDFTEQTVRFADQAVSCKKFIMLVSLASEIHVLAWQLDRITEQHRWSRDFTLESLRFALREVIACLPVYRTYIRLGQKYVEADDRKYIEAAVKDAKRRNPATSESIFDFIGSVLLLDDPDGLDDEQIRKRRQFVMQFQQVTPPVEAKGIEDTAFYRTIPLISLNEVGGNPDLFGSSVSAFHKKNLERLAEHPGSMNATSTHDAKRMEDARARINVLTEMPAEWEAAIRRWRECNSGKTSEIHGVAAPDPNEEYLLYQTLIGAWPAIPFESPDEQMDFGRRIKDYMIKALREAKVHSSWFNSNDEYETATSKFIDAVLSLSPENKFLPDFLDFEAGVARGGMLNSISQTLLKIFSPGVPDFYQGTELWDFSLVDPDNRRPVDYGLRRRYLDELKPLLDEQPPQNTPERAATLARLLVEWQDGRIKLFITALSLRLRRTFPTVFGRGVYVPLITEGERTENIMAFARAENGNVFLVVVPRLMTRQMAPRGSPLFASDVFVNTNIRLSDEIAQPSFRNLLTGETVNSARQGSFAIISAADLFRSFPVALLRAEPS